MVKLTPTGVNINTNLVWSSHNTGVLDLTPEFLQWYTYGNYVNKYYQMDHVRRAAWNFRLQIFVTHVFFKDINAYYEIAYFCMYLACLFHCRLLLRLSIFGHTAQNPFGFKYGCHQKYVKPVLEFAKKLELRVVGVQWV